MNISFLISLLLLVSPPGKIPNYFRTYPSAKAEALKTEKDLLIFFTSPGCEKCNSAWNAFTGDAQAVSRYVSTQVLTTAFDGEILFENFNPGSTPSWVIVDSKGEIKEKWQGGWKDAYGKGTLYQADIAPGSDVALNKTTPTPTVNAATSNVTSIPPASKANPEKNMLTSQKEVKPSPSSLSETTNAPVKGFVIQAGYFGSSSNADRCLSELKTKGFTNFSVQQVQVNGSTFYRVWSTTFGTESEAQANIKKLTAVGLSGTVKSCP